MTKRDCEAFFRLIQENVGKLAADGFIRDTARTAADLLQREREHEKPQAHVKGLDPEEVSRLLEEHYSAHRSLGEIPSP